MRLRVVLPTYNEIENLEPMVRRILALPVPADILIVDDSSPDGTADLARRLAREFAPRIEVLQRPVKAGLGSAYRGGFRQALTTGSHELVAVMDCDFSHDPDALPLLANQARTSDLVIGSRYIVGGGVLGWGWHRRILSRTANRLAGWWLGMPVADYTSGFMLLRRAALERIPFDAGDAEGYAATVELKCLAYAAGLTLTEVPILFRDRERGTSKLDARIIIEAMRQLRRMRQKIARWRAEFAAGRSAATQAANRGGERDETPARETGCHHAAADLHQDREPGVESREPPAADIEQEAGG